MFLKSLTLKGFKSFADTTTLEFEPGVCVVVGPNGSGKSNIVDAVAWVLGAQGPKTVRSQKMEDVIFAGSSKRQALGRAEVSLTIDNSTGMLPIDFTEVTITRTLFRSGDSEYAINGAPCRLLDLQELLSDTGVGRQQHVIVSQGNLDGILNAQPFDRRAVIEEAAGILKYRKRKEKAERRLESTEGNLLRLQDLLREVRRQIRPLERQADAARRHGAVAEELGALRKHLAGRELAGYQAKVSGAAHARADLGKVESEVRQVLARLDIDVLTAEAEMDVLRARSGDDLADVLGRAEATRERLRGMGNLLAERARSIERGRHSAADANVTASVEADAARTAAELAQVEAEAEGLLQPAEQVLQAEAALGIERAAFADEWGEREGGQGALLPEQRAAAGASEAAEVRGELSALTRGADRTRSEQQRLDSRLAALTQRADRLADESTRLRREAVASGEAEATLVEAADRAEARLTAADAALTQAELGVVEAEGEHHRWSARADALAMALDEARARAGAERLADIEGVLGTLLELVEVDEGWAAPFEAAAGEAIAAVVVDGTPAARTALAHLHRAQTTGAVLALLDAATPPAPAPLALFGEPVRGHVRGRVPGMDALLDTLLDGAVALDSPWEDALDLALAERHLTVVTMAGDRFATGSWRVGAGGTGATGAALDEAQERASAAAVVAADKREDRKVAKDEVATARADQAARTKELDSNDARLTQAGDALVRLDSEQRDITTEAGTIRGHLAELAERISREDARVEELASVLPQLEAEEAKGNERIVAFRTARSRMEQRVEAVRALRRDLQVRAGGLEDRRTYLTKRLAELEERLRRHEVERAEAAGRRSLLEREAKVVGAIAGAVAGRLAEVDVWLGELRERRRKQAEESRALGDRLEHARRDRSAAERRLVEVRERTQRAELDEAEGRIRVEASVESIRRELDCEPEAAIAADCPELPPGATAPTRVRELERDLRLMGPINPLALEELTSLVERQAFLDAQLEDVRDSRRELGKIIRAVDSEIVEVFAAAYAEVAEHYATLFEKLFPGGAGRLRLTEPDNLLDTGIDIEARPGGKNVRKLSLLSGGERSLTAMAFLFAVFRSRPSPFYLMDEVEAALDDVNLHRFLSLVHDFRDEAQLLIVSHQKRTMEAADCLYGVTMQPGGSSRVLSEKVGAGSTA